MRTSSVARVFLASLGVSVVITLGCGTSPGGPSLIFSVGSISPAEGSVAATVALIKGTGFQSGDTVTVDGSRVDATVLSATTISLTMPAHAAGTVDVTVSNPLRQVQASVRGGYRYVGPPVISEVLPNTGSTDGGTPIVIVGANGIGAMESVATVTVDGIIVSILDNGWPTYEEVYLSTPAHAAGTVEVIVTDRYGQTGSGMFTYASPATFDFNGDWEGSTEPAPREWPTRVMLKIRDNMAVSVLCVVCRDGTCPIGPSLTLDPPPAVADGEFSFAGSDGVSITGKIRSSDYASGSITMPSCVSNRQWTAWKK